MVVTETVIEVKVGATTIPVLTIEHNVLGPSDTQPSPSSPEFTVIPTPIEIDGIKFWIEWRAL